MDFGFNISGKSIDLDVLDIMDRLGYNDLRSVLKWCKKNRVIVFNQGKRKLINRTQFLIAFYKPFIEQLRKKHPNNWSKLFESYLSNDVENAMNTANPKTFPKVSRRYQAQSEKSKSFLDEEGES